MTLFYHEDWNPLGFCCFVQIRAFVIETSLGWPYLSRKEETKRILVVVSKWRHRANGLFCPNPKKIGTLSEDDDDGSENVDKKNEFAFFQT